LAANKSLREQLVDDANAHHRQDPAVTKLSTSPPPAIKDALDGLLLKTDGYRDVSLLLLRKLLRDPAADISRRFKEDRTASNALGKHLREALSVAAVKSSLSNNTFRHGFIIDNPQVKQRADALTALINWAKRPQTTAKEIAAAYHYLFAKIIATARDVPPFPNLTPALLLHRVVCDLMNRMMEHHSGGAVEQYLAYGLLRSLAESTDRQLSANTKDRNASDATAGVLGDIQMVRGRGNVFDVIEVTAHAWYARDKISQAVDAITGGGQQRVTILGDLGTDTPATILERLKASGLPPHVDVSRLNIQVLDLKSTLPVLVALAPNAGGVLQALRYAYERIAELPDTQHAKRFVELCQELGLTQ
jgi:hypothetical protein